MTRAANLAEAAGSGFAFRNRIINGAFQVWQRGTSFTANGYGPDRFYLNVAGTATFTQETSVVPSGAQYALKWTTGAASSYGQVRQWLEQLNVIPLRGLTVTASAMVQVSANYAGTLTFEIASCPTTDATSGTYTQISLTQTGTTTSSGYTKITATFTVPSNAVGLYIGVVPNQAQASGVSAYVSQIQLEPGATATPFENRQYGIELALCQRYYEQFGQAGSGAATGATSGEMGFKFSVDKRVTPTITLIGTGNPQIGESGVGMRQVTSLNGYIGSPSGAYVAFICSGANMVIFHPLVGICSNFVSGFLAASAEL